eukprot:250519-Prymnesium_polylepis.1
MPVTNCSVNTPGYSRIGLSGADTADIQQRNSSDTAAIQQRYSSGTAAIQQQYSSNTAAIQQQYSRYSTDTVTPPDAPPYQKYFARYSMDTAQNKHDTADKVYRRGSDRRR